MMKKIGTLIILALFVAFTANAQVSSAKQKQVKPLQAKEVKKANANEQASNPNGPVIKFDKTTHDYGTIKQYGKGNCEFKFTNEGKEPLLLTNVRSSCGCTVPTWPREPIMPGQSRVIKVKYDTKRLGVINKTIHVYSNATTPSVTLRIKGKVVGDSTSTATDKKPERRGADADKK